MNNKSNKSCRITITGRVQGVGFRPHVYRMASEHGLSGYINNSVNGVEIEVSGEAGALDGFVARLREFPPPLAVVEKFCAENIEFKEYSKFEILHSDPVDLSVRSVFVSPDLAVCADCASEIFDAKNRRYGYAFTNCTNCGPRYTITRKLPYDRPVTTMAGFKMCPKCQAEYDDPMDRRFHAQPNACPECGPGLAIIEDLAAESARGGPGFGSLRFSRDTLPVVRKAAAMIMEGRIGALMGLGGFHIACRADSDEIVFRLRESKNRPSKPFALMAPSMEWIRRFCEVSPEEEELLRSSVSPIVLLRRRGAEDFAAAVPGPRRPETKASAGRELHGADFATPGGENNEEAGSASMSGFKISELVAPENNYLGFMLPYTPLHLLLMKAAGVPLIMTSANISDEPICYRLLDAVEKLSGICDFAMAHDREILIPCDDSVCFVERGKVFTVRPSRGIAPCVIPAGGGCPGAGRTNIAVGAILKNTVSFNLENRVLVSQYIGDTDNADNYDLLVSTAERFAGLYNLKPAVFVCDDHHGSNAAGYAAREAVRTGAEFMSVAHHYAHTLAVMAENGLDGPVFGLSFDGTGLGADKSVWGGEFLICDTAGYRRAGYFEPFRVANYDGAVKNVSKLALCAAHEFFGGACEKAEDVMRFFSDFDTALSRDEMKIILKAVEGGANTVKTTSLGRIFDVVSAVAGFNRPVSFEGEAAIWLEMRASAGDKTASGYGRENASNRGWGGASPQPRPFETAAGGEAAYPFKTVEREGAFVVEWREMLKCAIKDRMAGKAAGEIAMKFHRGLIAAVYETACLISERSGVKDICLSGGVFYNRLLLRGLLDAFGAHDGPSANNRGPFRVHLPQRLSFGDSAISAGQCYYAMKRKRSDF